MNKYLGYFLIMVCTFMIIALCIYLGICIDRDIRGGICGENNVIVDKP